MSYTISFLCSIRKLSHVSYANFTIQREVRSRIIDLGIRKQPGEWQLYRRSRARCKLFSKIHAITSKKFSNTKAMTTTGINLENLQYPSIRLIPLIPRTNALTISHVNVRSIWNKILQFQQVVLEENIDIYAITETWIKHNDKSTIKDVSPINYKGISYPRSSGKSGVALHLSLRNTLMYKITKSTMNQK